MSESQTTSREAHPCRETGEELLRKRGFPFGDQVEQLAGPAQESFALRTTEVVRRYGPHETMTRGAGILLLELSTSFGQCCQLATQPSQHPPHGHVMKGPFINGRRTGGRLITDDAILGSDCLAVRPLILLHVDGGEIKQCRARVTFVREYESRGNQ